MTQHSAAETFRALGFAVLEPQQGENLRFAVEPPDWFTDLLPDILAGDAGLQFDDPLPYLANFLFDAREFWASNRDGQVKSGPWTQSDSKGAERVLEASAVCALGQRFLLVELLGKSFQEERSALQYARDNQLAYEQLDSRARRLVTERDEFSERTREAERLNLLKSEFLAHMSHELRTPLNAILGFSGLLTEERAGDLNGKQKDYLGHVTRSANHLLDLINDILDLAKIEAGREELRCSLFPLSTAAEEAIASVRPQADEKEIHLSSAGAANHSVWGDRTRIRQILCNLLGNAVKFTERGGTVSIECADTDEVLEVRVRDNGIGIPAAEREAVFDKFYQVTSSTRRSTKGTGLGLAITRKLVEMHRGTIVAGENPGGGSVFTLRLPAAPNVSSLPATGAAESLPLAPSATEVELRIAVVEDDPASGALFEAMLESCGSVVVYASGEEALEGFQARRPDVVLLDISLPGISGLDVLRRMRVRPELKGIPAVAVSAHAMEDDVAGFQEAGFNNYFTKPIADGTQLVRTVRELGQKSNH